MMTSWKTIHIETGGAADATLVLLTEKDRDARVKTSVDDSLARAIEVSGFEAREGRWLDLVRPAEGDRLLLLGLGAPDEGRDRYFVAGGHVIDAMRALRLKRLRLPEAADPHVEALVKGALLHSYRLDEGRKHAAPAFHPEALIVSEAQAGAVDRARTRITPVNRARAWTEQPANRLSPTIFAQEAKHVLEAAGFQARILDRAALESLGAHALLAVASGSHEPPCMLVAEWRGAPDRAGWDVALVGKGLTFDGGGLNLKTRPIIEKMKFDMGGAAAVIGAAEAFGQRRAAANVVVIVPMTENSIGSDGYRPGDVISSLDGMTIEVLNTDAEGRLVLADGISFAIQNYAPDRIVDVATLTGMITGVLHEEYAGLYANDDLLADGLAAAGRATGEMLWRLPLSASQDYLVDSTIADVSNLGAPGFLGVGGGSPAAGAKFVQRFARDRKWAHIDIAGTAWSTRRTDRGGAGATGFGVAMLDRWIAGVENELSA